MNVQKHDRGIVLIVDDTPTNLSVLFDLLTASGFKVLVAEDGEDALEQVEYCPPDLILLDVLMPGINGFETCRRLKANKLTKEIPVIFMTALADTADKVMGLNLGAVDYITKPLQHEEVLARVSIHLNLWNLAKKLQDQNVVLQQEIQQRTEAEAALLKLTSELEMRVKERTNELGRSNELLLQSNEWLKQEIEERLQAEAALQSSEAQLRKQAQQLEKTLRDLQQAQSKLVQSEKMSSLGQLVAGVAHEINNPVNFIYGNLIHTQSYTKDLINTLMFYQQKIAISEEIQQYESEIDLEFLIEDLPKMLASMKVGIDRIREIVQSLKNFSRVDEAEMKSVNIHEGIDSTLLILHNRLKARSDRPAIEVVKQYGNLPIVECYPGQLNQVFMNLLANAIDALEESLLDRSLLANKTNNSLKNQTRITNYNPTIWIRTESKDNSTVIIQITDNGLGMDRQTIQRLFDPFFTTKPTGKGTGLGLSISHQIVVEKHGGQLKCMSVPNQATEFTIELPIHQRHQKSIFSQTSTTLYSDPK